MKVLVLGSGAREHAIAWKLSQSPKITRIFVSPGNAGTAQEEGIENITLPNFEAIIHFVKSENIRFTVVGPEVPLAQGIVDEFQKHNLAIFGPTQIACQLESSKDFAKQFMQKHNIPTAKFATFSNLDEAHHYIDEQGAPIVIKADGLASGKGVIVAQTLQEAHDAVDLFLKDHALNIQYDQQGARVVIEEFLEGEEASFIVMCDGLHALALATSQDHKRLLTDDLGPNTGGMGAYSPAPVVTPEIHARIMREIIHPTLQGLNHQGIPYTGFLYAGLMINPQGEVKVIEFNCRLGDPETQPILMRLKTDLVDLIEMALLQKLDQVDVEWDRRVALTVVMAAENYPQKPTLGDSIIGLPIEKRPDIHVFHAGTTLKNQQLTTNGGRVLSVTALGDNIKTAQATAYQTVSTIHFRGSQYRSDIGFHALDYKHRS